MSMTRSFKNQIEFIAFISLCLIFYNEFAVYWISYMSWPARHTTHVHVNKTTNTNDKPVTFLLVADPQLIGENDEFYGWLARWDSDRYLKNTYLLANSFVKPDATIYLGDLFDEGLKASNEQYERYFKRFNSIFQCEKMSQVNGIKQIYIPGDNDIGGEYFGDRNDKLADRYEKYFGPSVGVFGLKSYIDLITLDLDYTVSFYNSVKRNQVLPLLNKYKEKIKSENVKAPSNRYTVLINHVSLVRRDERELNMVI